MLFRLHILGCGSATPTLRHNPAAQIVEADASLYMIDCGEGTLRQMMRSRLRARRLKAIFISHTHGDHCLGLMPLLSSFVLTGRKEALHIYAPAHYEPLFRAEVEHYCSRPDFPIVFHPVQAEQQSVIYEDPLLTVETLPLDHCVPCCGFLFRQKQSDSRSQQTSPPPPRVYAYCSDTRYLPTLHRMVSGVNLLYHEATYTSEHLRQAVAYKHSTASEAATVAKDAQVERLLIGHFSSRYKDENAFLAEAKCVFPHTEAAEELDCVNI